MFHSRSMRLAVLPVVAACFVPSDAFALSAEAQRLVQNIKSLAEKNAWTGVERNYEQLIALGEADVPFTVHMLGAQAAQTQGKAYEYLTRLEAALAVQADPDVQQSIDAIKSGYGRLRVIGKPRMAPQLAPRVIPFAPDQRKAIEYATTYLAGAGSFEGMVPVGEYAIGNLVFTVETGDTWKELKLKNSNLGPPDFGDGTEVVAPIVDPVNTGNTGGVEKPTGAVIYAGPIATLGFGHALSGAPTELGLDPNESDGTTLRQPDDFSTAGFGVTVGGEVGLSYVFGVAGTIGYQAGLGTDSLTIIDGSLQAAIRPGDLRIGVGPSYAFISGKGTGLADSVNIEGSSLSNEQIEFEGSSFAAGGTLSVSYGLLDLNKLHGVVEVGGSWKHDSVRSWTTVGVRFGIVPQVPRFKGD